VTSWIKTAFEETPGVASSQRVAFLSVTGANVLAFLVLVGCVAFGKIADIPAGVITAMGLLQGVATAGKVIQQRGE
jgi:hypothetical protein